MTGIDGQIDGPRHSQYPHCQSVEIQMQNQYEKMQ